ncbi:MAG: PIG-L deacetylase family protein [Steroidobacterales bacterium]|jgi:LmbE family N-acetylglucosaminyl deacetylase
MTALRAALAAAPLALLAALATGNVTAAAGPVMTGGMQDLPPLGATTSLLVVAPHPDDETLCCAGIIQRVVRAGGRVSIVWITSGDASELDMLLIEHRLFAPAKARELGARRMREARAAATLLGVPAARQLFMGFPDRGVLRILNLDRTSRYTSGFTDAAAVPYSDAVFPGHPYTRDGLEQDFEQVLARVAPTLILAPTPRDAHPDHRAAGLLATAALARSAGSGAQLRYWIVHGGEGWPSPRGLEPGLPLTAAPRIRGVTPAVFTLTTAEEDGKLAALRAYDTQLRGLKPFLLAFVRSTELFAAEP